MKLREIRIKNMRLFNSEEQTLKFDEKKRVTVLLANNGCGKTTVLSAIVNMLSPFVSVFAGNKLTQFADEDVHITSENHKADFLKVEALIDVAGKNQAVKVSRTRKGEIAAPDSDIKEIKEYADDIYQHLRNGEEATLPILAYYSTERGRIKAPERKRDFQKVFERWDCYNDALEAQASFKRFFSWYDLMEEQERRAKVEERNFDYRYKPLQVVREALGRFIGDKYSNPRILMSPLRFVMDEHLRDGQSREIRLELMSDGFRNVTAMVADIASRMAEANPDSEQPLDEPGIILIDEVDLHLHPNWQRTILSQLCETFRGVQFIVTTHSPVVLLGATDLIQVVKMGDGIIDSETDTSYDYYNVGQLLLSPMFGIRRTYSAKWDKMIDRRDDLLSRLELSEQETKELQDLDTQLSPMVGIESLDAIKSRKLLEKMAHQLGIEI